MGKTKANKRQKPSFSGEDTDSPTRAKRYDPKLFSILLLGLIRVGLSISFGITGILEPRLLDLLVALFYESMANPQSHEQLSVLQHLQVCISNGEFCRSRDSFIPVFIFLFYNLNARAFLVQAFLEPSTTHHSIWRH